MEIQAKIPTGPCNICGFNLGQHSQIGCHCPDVGSTAGFNFGRVFTNIPQSDPINPPHYKSGPNGMELFDAGVVQFGKDKMTAYAEITAWYYRMRAGKKDPDKIEEDIKKALWYEAKVAELANTK
jgi:hypothetical protein